MAMETALIHRARLVGSERGSTRSAQGEYERVPVTSPWIPARLMERGGVAAKARGTGGSTEARVVRSFELLIGAEDESGAAVEEPTASGLYETDCDVLGSPTVVLSGDPELLNDGDDLIGFLCWAEVPKERS